MQDIRDSSAVPQNDDGSIDWAALTSAQRQEIIEKLYQNSFDVRNTYLVLKDENHFSYLSFKEEDDKMILDRNLTNKQYRELALKKGHNNIFRRKNFLVGRSIYKYKK